MPGSSNFIQVNPSQVNQENDAAYAADPATSGGIGFNSIVGSVWFNKFAYQCSTFIAAFGQMLAAKGYAVSDANENTLAAQLANIVTNADQRGSLVQIPFSPTPNFNAASFGGFYILLTGNVSGATLSGLQFGQEVMFVIQQDGVGGRSFAWPTNTNGFADPDLGVGKVSAQKGIVLSDGNLYATTPMTVTH